jgi:hypothetical protein
LIYEVSAGPNAREVLLSTIDGHVAGPSTSKGPTTSTPEHLMLGKRAFGKRLSNAVMVIEARYNEGRSAEPS